MTDILHVNEWIKLLGTKEQFFFVDPESNNSSVVSRIIDEAVFFAGDEVSYNDGEGSKVYKSINRFDINLIVVHMNDGSLATINELEFVKSNYSSL